jgi:hypothetical protein
MATFLSSTDAFRHLYYSFVGLLHYVQSSAWFSTFQVDILVKGLESIIGLITAIITYQAVIKGNKKTTPSFSVQQKPLKTQLHEMLLSWIDCRNQRLREFYDRNSPKLIVSLFKIYTLIELLYVTYRICFSKVLLKFKSFLRYTK